jgi:hypothetical protein
MDVFLKILEKITEPIYLTIIAISSLFIFTFKSSIKKMIENFRINDVFKAEKKVSFKYKIEDLINHDVFSILEIRKKDISEKFYTHDEFDEVKTKVFQDFVKLKMNSTIYNLERIIKEYSHEMNEAELKTHIVSCFLDCNDDLGDRLRNHFKLKKISETKANILMTTFLEVRRETMEIYLEAIERVFASPFYETSFQKINAVLESVAFESKNMISTISKTFHTVNGIFKEIKKY